MSEVKIMSFEKETQLNEVGGGKYSYIKLGLYTTKAAKFINDAIEGLIESLPYKYYRYGSKDADNVRGGGLFVRADGRVKINMMNEVCIEFLNNYAVSSYVRIACSKTEVDKSIKMKLAHLLKKYWNGDFYAMEGRKEMEENRKKLNIPVRMGLYARIEGEDRTNHKQEFISETEFNCLYDFLRGKGTQFINKKYKKEICDSIIGHQIEDQFIISGVEVLKAEIVKKETEFKTAKSSITEEYNNSVRELQKIHSEKINNITKEFNLAIQALKDQMKELIQMGMTI